jgi:predicted secreted protein
MNDQNLIRAVSVGQKFAVELESMPGAGYTWEIAGHPDEIELLKQEMLPVSNKTIGGPAKQRFTLVANQPGEYSLDFQLKRRWEKDPVKTSQVSIQVQ